MRLQVKGEEKDGLVKKKQEKNSKERKEK